MARRRKRENASLKDTVKELSKFMAKHAKQHAGESYMRGLLKVTFGNGNPEVARGVELWKRSPEKSRRRRRS